MSPDLINGLFEVVGALFVCLNIKRLHDHKVVRGVAIEPVVFWSLWGLWNLYFYPFLGQWWSFYGGVAVVVANSVWVVMALHYTRRERHATAANVPARLRRQKPRVVVDNKPK